MPRLTDSLVPSRFEALPGWREDGHDEAFAAFRRSALHSRQKPYRTGSLGIDAAAFGPACDEALSLGCPDGRLGRLEARAFFERHFVPCLVKPLAGGDGFVTGFYEPVAKASPVRTDIFRFPAYRRPDDLVELEEDVPVPGLDAGLRFARQEGGRLVEYFDRRAIEQGALSGRGLEIAWLADKVDLFFIHVQGAARLVLPDGSTVRITYAAKSGHPFTGAGSVLIARGALRREDVTMQTIRRWLADHPDAVDQVLWENRSFIFFREAAVDDPSLGPIAAAKVPLTPGRSLAVDRLLHTFATPFHIEAPTLDAFGGQGFRRLMIAQDTGSAIVGPARGDLFAGCGDAAGEIAGVIRHPATFHALVPRSLVEGPP